MSIYEKLLTIQGKLKAPKNQYSDFGGYYYRSCEDIVEAIKPLAQEVKALLVLTDDIKLVGDRHYIEATAKLIDLEGDGEIAAHGYARETESRPKFDVAQLTGTASSYARKYALNGLFCIDDTKDPDALPPADNAKDNQKAPATNDQAPAKINSKQLAELQALAKQKGTPIEKIVQGYKLNSLQDMNIKQWAQAMNGLRKRADVQ